MTSIFMLHELPPSVRHTVLAQAALVLKPGGRLILMDSLQRGDIPAYDAMLESFPQRYHEPYYGSYLGLLHRSDTKAFLSKLMVFVKLAAG